MRRRPRHTTSTARRWTRRSRRATTSITTRTAPGSRSTEIPADRASYGVFDILGEQSQQRTKGLLEESASGKAATGSDERKVGDYYASYLDEATIETRGAHAARAGAHSHRRDRRRRALSRSIGESLRADVDPLNATNFYTDRLFGFWFAQDLNDPSRQVPYLLQGGLGMPDRDYYIEDGKAMDRVRAAYRAHLANVLTLAKVPDAPQRPRHASSISNARSRRRMRRAPNQPTSPRPTILGRARVRRRKRRASTGPRFSMRADLIARTTFIVWQPEAIAGIARLVAVGPIAGVARLPHLPRGRSQRSGVLPKAFADEGFAFYGKALNGTEKQRDRWKRAVDATNGALGDAVGKIYAAKYFPPASKAQLKTMVADISTAFGRRIDALTWMSPKTKAECQGESCQSHCRYWLSGYVARLLAAWRWCAARLLATRSAHRSFEYPVSAVEARATTRSQRVVDGSADRQRAQPAGAERAQLSGRDPRSRLLTILRQRGEQLRRNRARSSATRSATASTTQGSQFDATGRFVNWWTPEDPAHFKAAADS